MIQKAEQEVREYFDKHSWKQSQLPNGQTVFFKNREPDQVQPYSFLGYSRKKGNRGILEVAANLRDFFKKYHQTRPVNVVSQSGTGPFLVTSGIQAYGAVLSKGQVPIVPRTLQVQPVVRTNYREQAGEGRISSFVNASTIAMPTEPQEYLAMVDDWMTFFSRQGLFMPDFNIYLKRKEPKQTLNKWDSNRGISLTFNYGGLGIADFGFFTLPESPLQPIADLGIGLERLAWAIDKNPTFQEIIGPLNPGKNYDLRYLDSLRTSTLLAMSGITSGTEAETQLRKFIPTLASGSFPSIAEGIDFYQRFWDSFAVRASDFSNTRRLIESEVNRVNNLNILASLSRSKRAQDLQGIIRESPSIFVQELVNRGMVSLEELRAIPKS